MFADKERDELNGDVETILDEIAVLQPEPIKAEQAVQSVLERISSLAGPVEKQRRPNSTLRVFVGSGLVAMVLALLVIVGSPRFSHSTALAWADVAEKVVATKSVKYRQFNRHEYYEAGANGERKLTRVFESSFTIHAMATGKFRYEDKNAVVVYDPDTGIELTLIPSTKQAFQKRIPKNEIPQDNIYSSFRKVDQLGLRTLGKKIADGKETVGFAVDRAGMPWKKGTRLWIDAKSRLPLSVEFEGGDANGQHDYKHLLDEFVFDAEVDRTLFRTTPPDGYDLKKQPADEPK